MILRSVFMLTAFGLVTSTAMAERYSDTGIDRCATKDHKGQYEHIALKIDRASKSKVILVGITFEGDTEIKSGHIVSRDKKINSNGVAETSTIAKLEDGSQIHAVELGDTEATAERSGQKFECGD